MTDQEYKRLYDRCTQGVATKEEQLLFEAYKDSFNLNDDLPWQDTMGDYSEIKARISDDLHGRLVNMC